MTEFHNVPGNGGGPLRVESGSASGGPQRQAATQTDRRGQPVERGPLGAPSPRTFADNPHLVMIGRPDSPLAERYRRIRLRLEHGDSDVPFKPQVTVITSAIPGEGKTTTATNLALAYAEDRKSRTLLVGADLRGPSVSRFLAAKPGIGLSSVLAGTARLEDALLEMSDSKLWVLPEGPSSERPLEIVHTEHLAGLIAELRKRFDRIVIDTPPTVPFTDAAILASHADATLLVVRARTTTKPLIRRAWESLSGSNVLGVVLNDVTFTVVDRYYNRYDDYEPGRYAYTGVAEASTQVSRRDHSSN
jgi:capsular exopolysaccharide synthesis family protein